MRPRYPFASALIPLFSSAGSFTHRTQLVAYEMRTQYPAHGERVQEAKVSTEELDDIQVFLLHRKPSGYPISPQPVPGPHQK